jgi:septal ring factor EnvC (AmiA/AmiB activator)
VNFDDLSAINWDGFASTEQWAKLLDALLALVPQAGTPAQRDRLADVLDAFADHSTSADFAIILKLDDIARRTAQALRGANIDQALAQLEASSGDLRAIAKEIGAVTATLQKEAAVLRAERLRTAVGSLTDTIAALKAVSQSLDASRDAQLSTALSQAMASAQKLRGLIEQKG